MKLKSLLAMPLVCLAVACGNAPKGADNPVLTIEGGLVQGVLTDSTNVMVYKGIPYAAPPTGELRWKKPQPVVAWDGVKIADKWGPAAMQAKHQEGQFYTTEFYWEGDPEMSEDCLYLNVWAPAATVGNTEAKLPVAMWIHGGAYSGGYGYEVTMDGDDWAQHGVILVTINYRLGILGFLSHPLLSAEDADHTSGNYGTYDQAAALKWIHNNIAQFGGDPNNITVFGQSAGAQSVKTMVTSPETKGLVAKAIIQSIGGIGEAISSASAEDAEKLGKDIMDAGGLTTLEQMRAASYDELSAAISKYMMEKKTYVMLAPHIDGKLLPTDFSTAAMKNEISDVPYMIGHTANDIFPLGDSERRLCEVRDSIGSYKAYNYSFNRALPGDSAGAFHSSELWFMFHTLKNSWRPFTAGDYKLSDKMIDYWTNFAKTGNPNANGSNEWPASTKDAPFVMQLQVEEE